MKKLLRFIRKADKQILELMESTDDSDIKRILEDCAINLMRYRRLREFGRDYDILLEKYEALDPKA